jgi:hypothetical protein
MPDSEPDTFETEHILGLDLGQSSDPSALTVTEKRVPVWNPMFEDVQRGEARYAVVWIERFDLGTRYTDVVQKAKAVKDAPQTGHDPPLVMDATGIGAPVVDQFHEAGVEPVQVVFTSGREPTVDRSGDSLTYGVPKRDLATLVQSLLQSRRLTIAEGLDGAGVLVREMKSFRVKMTDAGHARFEHATESETDDVLLSLACALWYAERSPEVGKLFTDNPSISA